MPDPIFTFHSALRLLERGITRDNILEAVACGEITEGADGKDVYALGCMRVVVVRENNIIVTAWRERRESAKRNLRKARKSYKKRRRTGAW